MEAFFNWNEFNNFNETVPDQFVEAVMSSSSNYNPSYAAFTAASPQSNTFYPLGTYHPTQFLVPNYSYPPPAGPDSMTDTNQLSYATEGTLSQTISGPNTPSSAQSAVQLGKREREPSSSPTPIGDYRPKKAARRSPTEQEKEETNKTREQNACLPCQLEKRRCNPIDENNPGQLCARCYKHQTSLSRKDVLCCRVNITDLEIFRYGPTKSLAQTFRYLVVGDSEQTQSRKINTLSDAPRRSAPPPIKIVRLSQGHGDGTLNLKTQPYKPRDGDKVNYTWESAGGVEKYECTKYALADLEHVKMSLEKFVDNNTQKYVHAVLARSSPITRKVFETALNFASESKLVKIALRFWVASRFIETPWHILEPELLGMKHDPRPSSPYFNKVPVTPIMDNQLDLIVIFHLLEPAWKKELRNTIRGKLLKHKKQDWFELQLVMFVLLNHVEQTTLHDIDFAKRHNLPTKFSNTPLIEKVNHAARTLLRYFHNPGINLYAPFFAPWHTVEADFGWKDIPQFDPHETQKIEMQKNYVQTIRSMLRQQNVAASFRHESGRDLSWTSQMFTNSWIPVEVNAYA